jgi:hypothetical protein
MEREIPISRLTGNYEESSALGLIQPECLEVQINVFNVHQKVKSTGFSRSALAAQVDFMMIRIHSIRMVLAKAPRLADFSRRGAEPHTTSFSWW